MTGVWACSGKTGGGILASSIAFRAATKVRMVAMVTDKEKQKVNKGKGWEGGAHDVLVTTASHEDTAMVVIMLHQCDPMWRK